MGCFIPAKYGRCTYPAGITPRLTEIAGNFDAKPIRPSTPFSLHTEYSFSRRKFSSPAVQGLDALVSANRGGVPMLWYSREWAVQFVQFVRGITQDHTPAVIEVHPPFSDYASQEIFLSTYGEFERGILEHYPDVTLLIENRSGTQYSGQGGFILSTAESLVQFSRLLDAAAPRLKITLDIPQLFTAHGAKRGDIAPLLGAMREIRHNIAGIHIWGKRKNADGRRVAHHGDLNDYFYGSQQTKSLFLEELARLLDDEVPRYLVPEVNSGQADFLSIIRDLQGSGFQFV